MIRIDVTDDALKAYMILQYNELEDQEGSKLVNVIRIAINQAKINGKKKRNNPGARKITNSATTTKIRIFTNIFK